MATATKSVLQSLFINSRRVIYPGCCCQTLQQNRSNASWSKFFKKEEKKTQEDWPAPVRQIQPDDGPTTVSRLDTLRKREGMVTIRGYTPPADVEKRILSITSKILDKKVELNTSLNDRMEKFQVLTRVMSEFDHFIPNVELTAMQTIDDVIAFFSTPVRDKSSYEDMARLDLPPNLHIQMEPVRFDAEKDTFFEGKSAFPGNATIVSGLKTRRKYKGNKGESRNQRSMTRFEEIVVYSRKT